MIDSFYVAWRYLTFSWARSLTLVACVTLIAVLPLALELLLGESQRQLLSRAETTPLVVGAKGSSLDLVMNSLYFGDTVPETISMAALDRVADTDLALPIPLYVRFKARGFPIVGTNPVRRRSSGSAPGIPCSPRRRLCSIWPACTR